MASYWHVLKSTRRCGAAVVQAAWDEERAASIITAGYGNAPDGPGRAKLRRYRPGDRAIIFAPGFGAAGLAKVIGPEPRYRDAGRATSMRIHCRLRGSPR